MRSDQNPTQKMVKVSAPTIMIWNETDSDSTTGFQEESPADLEALERACKCSLLYRPQILLGERTCL